MEKKYKGVCKNRKGSSIGTKDTYQAYYKGKRSYHKTPESAAKWVDIQLIKEGKQPVNILKQSNA